MISIPSCLQCGSDWCVGECVKEALLKELNAKLDEAIAASRSICSADITGLMLAKKIASEVLGS